MAKQVTNDPKNQAARQAAKESGFGRWDFVAGAPAFGIFSILMVVASLVVISIKGFNYGIDFAGGTELQVRFEQSVPAAELRQVIEQAGINNPGVQALGEGNEFLIRLETPRAESEREVNQQIAANVSKVREALKAKYAISDDAVLRVDTVGPAVGSELKRDGLLAAFYGILAILIYIALRFDYQYAPGAILSLIHDTVVTLGIFSLLGREVNIQIMAAILTLIGYSINDTIVTFDRIREVVPQYRDRSLRFILNKAINDMLSRTFLTTGTTMIGVLALYIFGGGVIADIAFALVIGIAFGTYSSIYVAAPAVLLVERFWKSSSPMSTATT